MQFAALRCFFPSTPLPRGLQVEPLTGELKHMSLTGDLHKKPTRNKMMYWASRSNRDSAKLLFFPTGRTWAPSRLTDPHPFMYSSNPCISLCREQEGTNNTGFWEHFWKWIAGGNQSSSQKSHQPFILASDDPTFDTLTVYKSETVGWAELASGHSVRGEVCQVV